MPVKMINKYWSNRKKIRWLNKYFDSRSDQNWGRSWNYKVEGPPYRNQVAYLPNETEGPDELEVYYDEIARYFNNPEKDARR